MSLLPWPLATVDVRNERILSVPPLPSLRKRAKPVPVWLNPVQSELNKSNGILPSASRFFIVTSCHRPGRNASRLNDSNLSPVVTQPITHSSMSGIFLKAAQFSVAPSGVSPFSCAQRCTSVWVDVSPKYNTLHRSSAILSLLLSSHCFANDTNRWWYPPLMPCVATCSIVTRISPTVPAQALKYSHPAVAAPRRTLCSLDWSPILLRLEGVSLPAWKPSSFIKSTSIGRYLPRYCLITLASLRRWSGIKTPSMWKSWVITPWDIAQSKTPWTYWTFSLLAVSGNGLASPRMPSMSVYLVCGKNFKLKYTPSPSVWLLMVTMTVSLFALSSKKRLVSTRVSCRYSWTLSPRRCPPLMRTRQSSSQSGASDGQKVRKKSSWTARRSTMSVDTSDLKSVPAGILYTSPRSLVMSISFSWTLET